MKLFYLFDLFRTEEFSRPQGILKTKRHNIPLIMSKKSGKSGFVPIIFTNLDLPESRLHVKLGKYHNFTQPMDQVILIGNRVPNPL